MTYLAVPIAAKNPDQAGRQIKAAIGAGAEALELRTDYLENLSTDMVKNLIANIKATAALGLAVIVTCRDKSEGGIGDLSDRLRTDVLTAAAAAGAEFIDFEYEKFLIAANREKIESALAQNPACRLILSAHNFETKFDNIQQLHQQIVNAYPAAIPKLVYTANDINDCFEAFDLLHKTSGDVIVFCMGQAGLISRIIAKKLNSFVTFASLDEKSATAPGQVTIEQFRKLYRYDSIKPDTKLFGVIADPVAHSMSPAIFNASFDSQTINALYLPLLVGGGQERFCDFMENVISRGWLDFGGFSVTLPHKQNALNYVRQKDGSVETLAEKIGAANTLTIIKSRLAACNTDYAGALDAVTSALGIVRNDLKDLSVAVLGAGGVARAMVAGLADAGAEVTIYNRTIERGQKLADEFGCDFASLDKLSQLKAKLLVNCTSIGMHPNVEATPLPKQLHRKDMAVFDTVYNPAETLLLKHAKEAGAKTIDGVSMFVNQAMAQFKLFAGTDGEAEIMRKTVTEKLVR